MTNREKYSFDFFTIENYKNVIQLAIDRGFQFILHKDEFNPERKDVIWRHDVEFSTEVALKMAEIENRAGVRTTYFFQLHTDHYNILSKYHSDILREIKKLGHHIGLHFDSHYYSIVSEYKLDKYIRLDAEYFENVFDVKLDTFSFHNTSSFILSCEDYKYGGLINVYSSNFKTKYNYCSDSNGHWRFEKLDEVLNDPSVRHLHVLIHDGMWSEEVLSPRKRIIKCVMDNAQRMIESRDKGLLRKGIVNIDD
jgi:hypothetical protein